MIQWQNEQLTVFESQLFKTTSTVIKLQEAIVIVDPTWLPQEIAAIREHVESIRGKRALYILLTHSDWDHLFGYRAFPEATIIASSNFDKRTDKEAIVAQMEAFDHSYYIDRPYKLTYPQVDITITKDGQSIELGSEHVTFYLAEGHTNDGIFAVFEDAGIWIAGDYLSDVEFPYIYDSSVRYAETMAKAQHIIDTKHVHYCIPGHGLVATTKEEMARRIAQSLAYIEALTQHVLNGTSSDSLIAQYAYPLAMRAFHEENRSLIERELKR